MTEIVTKTPRISAIVPLYNGEAFILQALASIAAQTLPPVEVIVVDDGSTDDGRAVVERFAITYPVTLLRKPNGGQSSARNFGVAHATGDLIALLDQDDLWYPRHLEQLSKAFAVRQPIPFGWTYGDVDRISETGRLVSDSVPLDTGRRRPKKDLRDYLGQDRPIRASASLIAREAFDAIGGFDERLTEYATEDFFVRLFAAGYQNAYVDKRLSGCREDPENSLSLEHRHADRMEYARKLIASYPDNEATKRFYVRDIIAPRFSELALAEAKKAVQSSDYAWTDFCLSNLRFLDGFMTTGNDTAVNCRAPLVSTIIPLFNGAKFIEAAIRSVLAQTVKPDEIIVVDDGSTDDGPEIVERLQRVFPIRLIKQKNAGQSAARNTGVDRSHGELLSFLDQDDIWYPNHLAELIAPFKQRRSLELGWAYSNLDEIDEMGNMMSRGILEPSLHPKRDLRSCLRQDMFILPSAAVISRRAFEAVGGFNERLSGYEDDDLFLRLFRAGYDNVFLPEALSKWRIFKTSCSFSPRMAESRLLYAKLLIDQFPNDAAKSLYYVRDLIAPRFFQTMATDLRRVVFNRNREQQQRLLAHMAFIVGFLPLRLRTVLTWLVLPALHIPVVARAVMQHRVALAKLFRCLV